MSISTAAEQAGDLSPHWPATLEMVLCARQGKTIPTSIKHFGPLRIQRPFYPEGDDHCHVYLLHPPGGVAGGDDLRIEVSSQESAKALITSPGAMKIYRSNLESSIHQSLTVTDGSLLEWMPHETIVFDYAQSKIATQIFLQKNSRLFFWDILCLGLPANEEKFRHGYCKQTLQISYDSKPLLIENTNFSAVEGFMSSTWGMQNHYVNAIAIMTSTQDEIVELIRSHVNWVSQGKFAITKKREILICRYMGDSVDEAKQAFSEAWKVWRKLELNKACVTPRIWNT